MVTFWSQEPPLTMNFRHYWVTPVPSCCTFLSRRGWIGWGRPGGTAAHPSAAAGLLVRKQVGPVRRHMAAGKKKQRNPMGSEGTLGFRDSSHILYSRVIEQSVLKTLGRRAGIQVSPSQQSAPWEQHCELWFPFLLFGPQHQLYCWAAWMVSERQRKTCHLLFSSDPSDLFRSEKSSRLPCYSISHASDVKPSQVILP